MALLACESCVSRRHTKKVGGVHHPVTVERRAAWDVRWSLGLVKWGSAALRALILSSGAKLLLEPWSCQVGLGCS